MKKKCIIIGSGLGGLACGVILAKNGYDVTVLEQGGQIGGCLQCFSRRGVKFETGMHFIGSADEGQTLSRLLNYLDVKKDIKLGRLDTDGYDVVSLKGDLFRFPNGRTPFIEQLSSYFPAEKDNLVRYYDLVKKIAEASSLHSLKYAESDMAINTEYQLRSINNVVEEIIRDPLLQKVLVGNLPLYAAEKDKTPFSSHAFIMDFYNQSAFRIIGGSDIVGWSLAKTIEKLGGQVLTRHNVRRILCDDFKATGVETKDEMFFPADIVISDTHPMRTLEMLDTKLIRPAFRNRINAIPNTIAGFSVYLHFKDNAVPYMNSNFYSYQSDSTWGCENYDEESWPKGYLYMHFCHKAKPEYAQSGVILSYMSMEEMAPWKDTSIGKRGNDYEAYKKQKAEKLLSVVEIDFPGLRNQIAGYYTSTPLTYRDYTGTQDGSMYGIAKDITLGVSCRIPHKTKIPNLLLTGQNINSHGMLGVLVGTIVTCSELLGADNIYHQIIEANK
jgi:all-trans-retinol 13,14-reductase